MIMMMMTIKQANKHNLYELYLLCCLLKKLQIKFILYRPNHRPELWVLCIEMLTFMLLTSI